MPKSFYLRFIKFPMGITAKYGPFIFFIVQQQKSSQQSLPTQVKTGSGCMHQSASIKLFL